jgi:LAO/AO transport system kinase
VRDDNESAVKENLVHTPSLGLVDALLAGEPRAIARLISRAEADDAEVRTALERIYRHTGRAHVVGVTGVPGSGKSTLIDLLVPRAREQGRKVGVIAVDPSSPFTGGSILGDRIRMGGLALDPGVFIRSMATRGELGGLARASYEAVDVLDAGGFDLVFVETVGVGQDEVDIVRAAHTVIVVSAPGLGDDIQAIKAGILEIADIHVVSKADRPDALKTVKELKAMLAMDLALKQRSEWPIPVLSTSMDQGQGVEELLDAIAGHRKTLERTGEMGGRRRLIAETRILKTAQAFLHRQFETQRDGRVSSLIARVVARELDPHTAALALIQGLKTEQP